MVLPRWEEDHVDTVGDGESVGRGRDTTIRDTKGRSGRRFRFTTRPDVSKGIRKVVVFFLGKLSSLVTVIEIIYCHNRVRRDKS